MLCLCDGKRYGVRAFVRFAFTNAIAALLVGCGGSQPPIGPPGAMPQSRANTGYTILYSFGKRYSGGLEPKAGLIDVKGLLYGTTFAGGSTACVGGCGVVFTITPSGKEKVLYRFGGNDGANPSASLIAVKGLLYGTTEYGGTGGTGEGTAFEIGTDGTEKVLHNFGPEPDGANPVASLTNVKGTLYGTTYSGGTGFYYGTVFKLSTSGKEKVLHNFNGSSYENGSNPIANLIDVNGTLYGSTVYGAQISSFGYGLIFAMSKTGNWRKIDGFDLSNGYYPAAGLIDVKGTLFGTTAGGGAYGGGYGLGTAFSTGTGGGLTTLHSFGSGTDGSYPWAPLLNVRGTLYGTTSGGGTYGKGTIFSMSLSGNETVLYSFGYGSDGATPLAGLIYVDGTLFGTTSAGGTYGNGTVFALRL
jgi:uncharacterized repeat protein (TIGR03803 family)